MEAILEHLILVGLSVFAVWIAKNDFLKRVFLPITGKIKGGLIL
jgi:hypothetical protein